MVWWFNNLMKLLVTHRSPDLDAISSVWCFTRFQASEFSDAKHAFVNAGESIDLRTAEDLGFSPEDVVHVDTGLGDFDHHQPERGMKRICATSLVYDYVSHLHPELQGDAALQFLVEYITAIDHFEECFWDNATDLKNNLTWLSHQAVRTVVCATHCTISIICNNT